MDNLFFNTTKKKFWGILLLTIVMMASSLSCGVNVPMTSAPPTLTAVPATPTCTPTSAPAVIPRASLLPPSPTAAPTSMPLAVDYSKQILSALPASDASCLPDKTSDDLGIYIYDLSKEQELVSINADVPFQFASAFKGPVLVYFMSQCKKYWDTQSPEWDAYFSQLDLARGIPYYTSPEYKTLIAQHFGDVNNWNNVEAFFDANRFVNNGVPSAIDKRYFILSKVYSMTTRSNNSAAGEVLQFVFDNCQPETGAQLASSDACYQPNAISQFNLWFNQFAKITYQSGEAQRGLFKWDVVLGKDATGNEVEEKMPTYGLEDQCVTQTARLKCSASTGADVWTARDFFKFYNTLYHLNDPRLRDTALSLLAVDNPGPARGNLKNLARKMGAVSMSKNGHAYYIQGSISTDAGIFDYKNTPFIVVILAYEAQPSLSLLYGDYNSNGDPVIDKSLIQDFLNQYLGVQ